MSLAKGESSSGNEAWREWVGLPGVLFGVEIFADVVALGLFSSQDITACRFKIVPDFLL